MPDILPNLLVFVNICKIITNILRQEIEKWKISNIFSFFVPQNLFAYLDIWPDVQDLLQYLAVYQRSGLRLGANQRSGSGQRFGISVSQRFGSGRRAKINLRLNTVINTLRNLRPAANWFFHLCSAYGWAKSSFYLNG